MLTAANACPVRACARTARRRPCSRRSAAGSRPCASWKQGLHAREPAGPGRPLQVRASSWPRPKTISLPAYQRRAAITAPTPRAASSRPTWSGRSSAGARPAPRPRRSPSALPDRPAEGVRPPLTGQRPRQPRRGRCRRQAGQPYAASAVAAWSCRISISRAGRIGRHQRVVARAAPVPAADQAAGPGAATAPEHAGDVRRRDVAARDPPHRAAQAGEPVLMAAALGVLEPAGLDAGRCGARCRRCRSPPTARPPGPGSRRPPWPSRPGRN